MRGVREGSDGRRAELPLAEELPVADVEEQEVPTVRAASAPFWGSREG